MFERELQDTAFIPRWTIVRTLRQQYLAEHHYLVTHYTNDLCIYFNVHPDVHLSAMQYSIWHDVDEIVSGDFPGPAKRALVSDRANFNDRLKGAEDDIFGIHADRKGGALRAGDAAVAKSIVKAADMIEAHFYCCSELQLGNNNMLIRVTKTYKEAREAINFMCDMLGRPDEYTKLILKFNAASMNHQSGYSKGCEVFSGGIEGY